MTLAAVRLLVVFYEPRGKVDVEVGDGLIVFTSFPNHLLNSHIVTAALSLSLLFPPLCLIFMWRLREASVE